VVGAAVVVSVAMNAFGAVAGRVVRPMYDRGVGQGVGSYVNAVASVLRVPGRVGAEVFLTRVYRPPFVKFWFLTLAVNFVLYAGVVAAGIVVWRCAFPGKARRRKGQGDGGAERGAGPTRRQFVARLTGAAGAGAVGVGGYSMFVEARAYRAVRRVIPIADLPAALDGLVLAQLADIHHGPWMPLEHVRQIVRTTNAIGADLVLLTGDHVLGSPVYAGPVVGALAELRARIGVVGVLGNHDWDEDGPGIRRGLERAGVVMLDNARRVLTPDRRLVADAADGLAICGVGDLWMDNQGYDAALGGLPAGMPRLLMSHNPDVAEEPAFVAGRYRVDLMVCGHLHGGQIRLPVVGAPWAPSRFGDKYARGLVRGPTTRVFTSPGLGMTALPVRLGARPEISVLELRKG
jgi:hypothetical protein